MLATEPKAETQRKKKNKKTVFLYSLGNGIYQTEKMGHR
jgi:hypothetical protein